MISFLIRHWIKDNENITSPAVQKAYAKLCSGVGIFFNVLLFGIKLLSGLVCGSTAMIADGFNNLSDAATSIASFIGFCLAGIGAGENHRFGHGRYEWLMGFLSSIAVIMVGGALAKNSLSAIHSPQPVSFNAVIVVILVCSILVKLYMYCYNKKIGTKIDSSSVKATATDCISDMVSTSAILFSLIVEQVTGCHIDGWCGLLVSLFIMFSGLKSMLEVVERLMGQYPDKNMENKIKACVADYPAIRGINDLLIHDYGLGHYAVSMHIEGYDGDSCVNLNAIAQEISYRLFVDMDCDATIQTDLLVTDSVTVKTITDQTEQVIKRFEATAHMKDLRIVKSGSHTIITLTVSGSRRLQKQENAIRQTITTALCSIDTNYQVIIKLVITALHRAS
ncbi:MAG: cation diffusion facilitator family transporter [Clostridiaceae bacterium]|nr:cation diffusion facilitator family transporter [Clostridiaceae bacterium]